jgi:hypothetical protein
MLRKMGGCVLSLMQKPGVGLMSLVPENYSMHFVELRFKIIRMSPST